MVFDTSQVTHHPAIEEIVELICNRTQNTDKNFFRPMVAFFLGKIASNMRVTTISKDRGEVPVNIYACVLGASGFGKGYSVSVMENEIINQFKQNFFEDVFPQVAEDGLWKLANKKAAAKGTDPNEEHEKVLSEFKRLGAYPFTFDSGTAPAVKQLRQKLLMASCGAISTQVDEIGSNLVNSTEILNLFLELYDQGQVKQKLTKNTAENQRSEEIDGKTPANMLLFGTPSKLLDGGSTESDFYSFLETGYARRCIFGYGTANRKAFHTLSAAQIYNNQISPQNTSTIAKWSDHFGELANKSFFEWKVYINDAVAIKLLEYKIYCEKIADSLPDHEEINKAEISHRYFKAMKLAGAYAFIDKQTYMTELHLLQAIKLVEESGECFKVIQAREATYEKLAKYIASCDGELTHADLHEQLPFYKSGSAARNEMMNLAKAWGYKKNIIIKHRYAEGIDFFKGETLQQTDIQKIKLSYSTDWTSDYKYEEVPFNSLHKLTQIPDHHWCTHAFLDKYRNEKNAIPGFNVVVLDIDGDTPIEVTKELLKEYTYHIHTTKRHTAEVNRYRIILPINYTLTLDAEEYKEFYQNLLQWLPIKADEATGQRSRKWATHPGEVYTNEGELLDVLPLIPKTSKNDDFKKINASSENLPNLEKWFIRKMQHGNRNNYLLQYALILADSGFQLKDATDAILAFNKKLQNPLSEDEIEQTIFKTLSKKYE